MEQKPLATNTTTTQAPTARTMNKSSNKEVNQSNKKQDQSASPSCLAVAGILVSYNNETLYSTPIVQKLNCLAIKHHATQKRVHLLKIAKTLALPWHPG